MLRLERWCGLGSVDGCRGDLAVWGGLERYSFTDV
jgi:hypothetical protein